MKALLELDYPDGSPFRNVHRYFATCMDQDAVEGSGAKPIWPLLDMIDGIQTHDDLEQVLAKFASIGIKGLVKFEVAFRNERGWGWACVLGGAMEERHSQGNGLTSTLACVIPFLYRKVKADWTDRTRHALWIRCDA